jgi:hypothetical protein
VSRNALGQSLLIAVLIAVGAVATTGTVRAQTPTVTPLPPTFPPFVTPAPNPPLTPPGPFVYPTLQRGDIAWNFARESPLEDSDLATLLSSLMARHLTAAMGDTDGRRVVRMFDARNDRAAWILAPNADASLLVQALQARTYRATPIVTEIGQCKIWAATPSGQIPPAVDLSRAMAALTSALSGALRDLGVSARACVATANLSDAHLLLWIHGDDPPDLRGPARRTSTFLWNPFLPFPSDAARGEVGDAQPRPPVTGHGATAEAGTTGPVLAAAALVAIGAAAGARMFARRPGG